MKIETLLQALATSAHDEMQFEPNLAAYFPTDDGRKNVDEQILSAAMISAAVFPLIPVTEKMRLPGVAHVSFEVVNAIGIFNFTVHKSPAGLRAVIRKIKSFAAPEPIAPEPIAPEPIAPIVPAPIVTAPIEVAAVVAAPEPPATVDAVPNKQGVVGDFKTLLNSLQSTFKTSAKNEPAKVAPVQTPDETVAPPPVNKYSIKIEMPELYEDAKEEVEPPAPPITQPAPPVAAPIVAAPTKPSPFVAAVGQPRINELFYQMAELKASDLHLSVSMPPMIRHDGRMRPLDETVEPLSPEAMRDLLRPIMPEKNQAEFEQRHDTDFAYQIADLARFRANVFMDRKGMGAVFRLIPTKILTAEQLKLSKAVLDLCSLSKGLVVVTGPTGSGKSTTLAAMVDYVNKKREDHIITIEDPIEFVHENQKCLINQREVHNHTDSFKDALRAALREDPDILLVGEMRDLETISIAIETAETGHLVFGTLHTTTAPSTVDRIIDQFPADRQQQIRVMLSESLKGVIAQTLLPKIGGGRVAALEILIVTPAISNLIREGKTFQIASSMQVGKQQGMVILNDALLELVKREMVRPEDAYIKAVDKTGLEGMFKRNNIAL